MRLLRLALIAPALLSSACFHMTTVLKIKADGSGTIEHSMLFTNAGLAQLRRFSLVGRGNDPNADPLSEQQARDLAAVIGEGVTYVSSRPTTTPEGRGRDAIYAFADVNQLKISTQPPAPGGLTLKTPGISTEGQTVTFGLTREPNGHSVLHIHVPDPNWLNSVATANASGQLALIKQVLAGARVVLAAEPDGSLVASSSPFVDGQRVTLLAVDLDEVLKDETFLSRLTGAQTEEEIQAIARNARGLKINFDREITMEFVPPR